MNTGIELEQWLRTQAAVRTTQAQSRRAYALAGKNLTEPERESALRLAEQMAGRRLPPTTPTEDAQYAKIQDSVAAKLEHEAEMLTRFADWVASI